MYKWIIVLGIIGFITNSLMDKISFTDSISSTSRKIDPSEGLRTKNYKEKSLKKRKFAIETEDDTKYIFSPLAKMKFSGITMATSKPRTDIGPYEVTVGWGDIPHDKREREGQKLTSPFERENKLIRSNQYMIFSMYSKNKQIQKGLKYIKIGSLVEIRGEIVEIKVDDLIIKSFTQVGNTIPNKVIWLKSVQIGDVLLN